MHELTPSQIAMAVMGHPSGQPELRLLGLFLSDASRATAVDAVEAPTRVPLALAA